MSSMIRLSEDWVRAVAHIIGPGGACAKAIQNAEARRAAGQRVEFYKDEFGAIIVHGVPALNTDKEGEQPTNKEKNNG
jgi:hypothetical protein